ncbi:hypothetical protein DFH11DRAFT_1828006 [Phellopilus nigrolimitatus]|nr:hypothetical protein DFH11DRAFT_1828006 [Phellopilus nigrolimitatus]
MPALTLPLTFANSFWSQNYRQGIETLYTKLEQGIEENEEIVAFIRARANAEHAIAVSLLGSQPVGLKGRGFNADEGASMLMAFRGLQAESHAQGEAHRSVAKELKDLVADPFDEWARGHKERIYSSHASVVDGWLKSYELAQGDVCKLLSFVTWSVAKARKYQVDKLKHQYLSKVRRADEAEDDAKFAPGGDAGDHYTTSPRLVPRDRGTPQRTASVSERIAQRFKELQRKAAGDKPPEEEITGAVVFDGKSPTSEPNGRDSTENEEKALPKLDKGKEKAVEDSAVMISPPPMSPALPPPVLDVRGDSPVPPHPPPPILLAGLALPPVAVSDLLKRAATELPLRPVKFPILGEYKDCFNGEELVVWLVDNVQGFGGSLDRAEDAAKDLTEREGVLRRVGEFGNAFESNDEAFYQFRSKAFNLEAEYAKIVQHESVTSPVMANLTPMADNLVKRSNTVRQHSVQSLSTIGTPSPSISARVPTPTLRTRPTGQGVRKLDRQRLGLEERLEDTLKRLQKLELDRLRAVKTVLLQFQGTLANLPTGLQTSLERSATLVASYQPEAGLARAHRALPNGPSSSLWHTYVYFGIDLRKWAEGGWSSLRGDEPPKDNIPEVLTALLNALNTAYSKLPNDAEKRKAWIYEVPLSAVHNLRERLNNIASGLPFPEEMLVKYDAPVIASTLDPPLGTWEGWDEIRRIYPIVGSSTEESSDQKRIEDLQVALHRLPRVHLLVLNCDIRLFSLIDTTTVEETNEVYMTKLALSMGRTILRPKVETELSIQDRHPILLFNDLLKHFDEIIPPTIARKKRDSVRKVPIRKRTAPIDMRMSRSRLSVANVDTRELLEEQLFARNPSMRPPSRAPSPNPATRTDAPPPPPPPTAETEKPAAPAPPLENTSIPPPSFKGPPAEQSIASPPMPVFKEPPPEKDDIVPPPMPKFADPPPEIDETLPSPRSSLPSPDPAEAPTASVPVTVAPPTPTNTSPNRSRSSSIRSGGSSGASPSSPADSSRPGASLARSGSAETSRLRGPRGARTANTRPQSGNVASMVAGMNRPDRASSPGGLARANNRLSYQNARSASPVNPQDYEPKRKGARTAAGNFSRRAMASDAEDDVSK